MYTDRTDTTERQMCAAAAVGVYCSPRCYSSRGRDCEHPLPTPAAAPQTTPESGYMSCPRECGVDVREHASSGLIDGRCDTGYWLAPMGTREIPFAAIESAFTLSAHHTYPAVGEMPRAGYYIRVVAGPGRYDYFYTDESGTITKAPRGYARHYKPGRIVGLEAAVAQYAGGAR